MGDKAKRRRGDKATRRRGDKAATGRRGDKATGRRGDKATGRQDKATRRRGDKATSPLPLGTSNARRYYSPVISSFRDRDTERLFHRELVRRWGPDVLKAGLRKLRMLDAASMLEDLKSPPGNRLEKLTGDRAGQWSIRVNDQGRISFRWRGGDAHDVEMVDYH